MKVLVYGADHEKLKAAAVTLRAEKHSVQLRGSRVFRVEDVETNFEAIILLEESELVEAAYSAYNANQTDETKKIDIQKRFDFEASDPRDLSKLEGRPFWPDMTVKQLIEYAMDEFGVKILGRKKQDLIDKCDLLWNQQKAEVAEEAEEIEIPIS